MSPGVIQVRADICGDCPAPCERQRDGDFHATPCAACPVRRWHQWGACKGDEPTPAPRLRGLGDAVAVVANPIARVLRIDPEKCGCKQRQEALNRAFPFKA